MDDRHIVEGIAFFEKIRDVVGRRSAAATTRRATARRW
jgi:hypothetical protein